MLILSLILVILTWPALYFTCLSSLLESAWVHFWVQVLLILSSDCVNEDSCGCPRPCQFVSNADAHPQTLYITMNQLRMHPRRWTSKRPQRSGTGTTFSPSGFQLPKPIDSHLKTPSSGYLINYSIGFTFLFWKLLLGTLLCTVFLLQTICFPVLRFSYLNWDRIAYMCYVSKC